MRLRHALLALVLPLALAAAEDRFDDGAGERAWIVAPDEAASPAAEGPPVAARAAGVAVDPVLYPADGPRTPARRRIVAHGLVVRGDRAAAEAAATAVGGEAPEATALPDRWRIAVADGAAALAAARTLRAAGIVADPELLRPRPTRATPDDPLFPQQWNLGSTAAHGLNVQTAWDTTVGLGVNIAIVDNGVQTTHPDLQPNCPAIATGLHHDWVGNDADPAPSSTADHGTSCAGCAAARGDNGLGVSGVAPRARLYGLRILGNGTSDAREGAALDWLVTATATHPAADLVGVSSNSWGPPDDGVTLEGPGPITAAALADGAANGRGGKGIVYVWAGGNGYPDDNSNYDGYANSPYTIAVAATAFGGRSAAYSERGSDLVVSAPSSDGAGGAGIVTTDLVGAAGSSLFDDPSTPSVDERDYATDFGGTSAAAPQVAGVVALMLARNPALGWRDVQEILIATAVQITPGSQPWRTNGAGFHFNPDFGAGLVDASAAVAAAATWTNLGPRLTTASARTGLALAIPDRPAVTTALPSAGDPGATVAFAMRRLRVEHAQIHVVVAHPRRGDLEFFLTSPNGAAGGTTTAWVASARPLDDAANLDWTFLDVDHWGESSQGTWTLTVRDRASGVVGTVASATLTLSGTALDTPPIAADLATSVVEDTPTDIALPASDSDGDALLVTTSVPAHGTVVVTGTTARYTPAADYAGADAFTYSVDDSYGGTDGGTVSITVTPVAEAPRVAITAPAPGAVFAAGTTAIPVTVVASDPDAGDSVASLTVGDGSQTDAAAPFAITGSPLRAGLYRITATATDTTARTAFAETVVTVAGPRPRILSTPELVAGVGVAWSYLPVIAGGAGGTATWTADQLPTGMTIVPATGQLQWTPGSAGDHLARIRVDDGVGFDVQEMVIHAGAWPVVQGAAR